MRLYFNNCLEIHLGNYRYKFLQIRSFPYNGFRLFYKEQMLFNRIDINWKYWETPNDNILLHSIRGETPKLIERKL